MQLSQVETAVLSTYGKVPLEVNYLYKKFNFIAIFEGGPPTPRLRAGKQGVR
jgi:hypothetical protein